jgi:putative SOS response-associated peptidase YedK
LPPIHYEWRDDSDGKTPSAVARIDGEPVAFGGIWESWKSTDGELLQAFATITTDANPQLAGIEDLTSSVLDGIKLHANRNWLHLAAAADVGGMWPTGDSAEGVDQDETRCSTRCKS